MQKVLLALFALIFFVWGFVLALDVWGVSTKYTASVERVKTSGKYFRGFKSAIVSMPRTMGIFFILVGVLSVIALATGGPKP